MLPRNLDRYIMRSLLYLQLENEKEILANRVKEGREDALALLVLARIQKEINTIQRLIDDEQEIRQKSNEPGLASRFVRYVREALYRLRDYENRRHYQVYEIPASAILQAQAGIR